MTLFKHKYCALGYFIKHLVALLQLNKTVILLLSFFCIGCSPSLTNLSPSELERSKLEGNSAWSGGIQPINLGEEKQDKKNRSSDHRSRNRKNAPWVNKLNRTIDTPKVGKGVKKIENNKRIIIRKVSTDEVIPKKPQSPQWVKKLKKHVVTDPGQIRVSKKHTRWIGNEIDIVGATKVQPSVSASRVVSSITKSSVGIQKSDILFVVDTTPSTDNFLTNRVKTAFNGFIETLSSIDYRIAFIDANYGKWSWKFLHLENDGELINGGSMWGSDYSEDFPYYITKDMDQQFLFNDPYRPRVHYNPQTIFIDTLRHHEHGEYGGYDDEFMNNCDLSPGCGGWTIDSEKPFLNLISALKHENNRSFFRPSAEAVIVIISDGDTFNNTKAEEVIRVFQNTYGNKKLRAYGIIMKPGDSACRSKHGVLDNYSVELSRLAKLTGGTNFGFCEKSYIPLAQKIVTDF